MIYECPEYALKFKCTASACSDSCCIGWEIGVDRKTRAYYYKNESSICKKARANLCESDGACTFKLLENGRCPMLDGENLCEIIKELGDRHIPEICREHPRFYNALPDRCEWGVGLSCEEAARLILTDKSRAIVPSHSDRTKAQKEDWRGELLGFISFARDRIFELIDLSPLPFFDKMRSLIYYAHALQDSAERGEYGALHPFIPLDKPEILNTGAANGANEAYAQVIYGLCEMDFLDSAFKDKMLAASKDISESGYSQPSTAEAKMLSGLLHYFIYRYFICAEDGSDLCAKVKLAVVLTLAIYATVGKNADTSAWISVAKALSREAEYNEENLDLIYELIFTEKAFSSESLIKILEG